MRPVRAATMLYALALFTGCSPKIEKVSAPANGAKDPSATPTASPEPSPSAADAIKDARVLDITMAMTGKVLGLPGCSGNLRLQIILPSKDSEEKRFAKIPEDTIKCFIIGNLGIAALLDRPADPNDPPPPPLDKLIVPEDSVLGFRRLIGPADYEPYRPFLPAFLSATPEELKAIDLTKSVTLKPWDGSASAEGTVKVKMTNFRKAHRQEKMNRDFENVYDFEFVNEGFDGVNRLGFFLFDKMTLTISLKPFAVLGLKLETRVSEAIGALSEGGDEPSPLSGILGGPLVGLLSKLVKVKIEGETIDLHGAAEETSDDPNETLSD